MTSSSVTPRLRRLAGRLTPFPRAAASGPSRRAPSAFWRIREDIPPRLRWILIAISLGSPLLIWWLVFLSGRVSELFLPSPVDAWTAGRVLDEHADDPQAVLTRFGEAGG